VGKINRHGKWCCNKRFAMTVNHNPKIAIVLKGYPRLSETFIAQEIRELEKRGLDAVLISLRWPTDKFTHPVHDEIEMPVSYMPEYLYREPVRVISGLIRAMGLPGFKPAFRWFCKDLRRDLTVNRIRRFGQAVVLAAELEPDVSHIHCHFLHTPASVARYAAIMRGLTWSFSAHAKDIWTIPEWEKREKIGHAQWGTTCTGFGHAHLAALAPAGERDKIYLSYHGLDFSRFPPPPERDGEPDGSRGDEPVTIVSVGRAVGKKGYDTLLEALNRLPADLNWRFVHVGGGPLMNALEQQARRLGLEARIEWRGAQAQSNVIDTLRRGHIFALACRIDDDGDRDGLPNVLMEAQAQKLPCVSTAISAIPELIDAGKTGVLVAPDDAAALAEALGELICDPARRRMLTEAGHRRLVENFSFKNCIDGLAGRFGLVEKPVQKAKSAVHGSNS
jgi:glycosyltransferase involved in cell wall biosynthesis